MSDKAEKIIYGNENLISASLVLIGTLLGLFPILILKDGGSWTFFSLLALWLITYFFGPLKGLFWSLIFGLCKFGVCLLTEDGTWAAVCNEPMIFVVDYMIACGGFCIGGFLPANLRTRKYIKRIRAARADKKSTMKDALGNEIEPKDRIHLDIIGDVEKENTRSGLSLGYLIGVVIMLICYLIAAPWYNDAYPAYVVTELDKFVYMIKYDGSYLMAEGLTTLAVLAIPKAQETVFALKHIAVNPLIVNTKNSF